MNITVKVLNGEECTVQVTDSMTILELKKEVESCLNIPVAYQNIIILGKSLVDTSPISAYPKIKDGTKLTLVLRKSQPLKEVIYRCFRKFYNEQQSQALAEEFMKDFEKKMNQLSLDDIERIASGFLNQTQHSSVE